MQPFIIYLFLVKRRSTIFNETLVMQIIDRNLFNPSEKVSLHIPCNIGHQCCRELKVCLKSVKGLLAGRKVRSYCGKLLRAIYEYVNYRAVLNITPVTSHEVVIKTFTVLQFSQHTEQNLRRILQSVTLFQWPKAPHQKPRPVQEQIISRLNHILFSEIIQSSCHHILPTYLEKGKPT